VKYLLDTCVISELVKPTPNRTVVDWLKELPSEALFLCAITIGEVRKGLTKLPDSGKKERLTLWLNTLLTEYKERILSIDLVVCENWGVLQGNAEKTGMTMPTIDSLIAATAYTHNLTLATRNESDFAPVNIPIINPWNL
jgi:predicted nucleic acid-binding protein